MSQPPAEPPSQHSTPWGPYPWEHQPIPDRPSTPWGPYPWEQNPDAPAWPSVPSTPRTPGEVNPGALQTFDTKTFVWWLGALVVLWFILSVLEESGNRTAAYSIAGLLLVGSLMFLGPQAIKNAQALKPT
jgi:hypothetical protein